MSFTPAQDAAIHARNRELLVSAAAGSGKTSVLIERIFTMIRDEGFSVDRMLIVTFTRAAAAEMRERLQTRMAEAAEKDSRMRRQAELLETAQISTLHSFCQKTVRGYFQAVDIDPLSALGDETVCANLKKEAAEAALDALYERADNGDEPANLLTAKFEEKQIAAMLDELYRFLLALPNPFDWLQGCAQKRYQKEDLETDEMAETLLADCRILASGIADLAKENLSLAEDPLCSEKYKPAMLDDQKAAKTLAESLSGSLTEAYEAANGFKLKTMPSLRNLEGKEKEIRDQYQKNRERMKKLAKEIASRLPQDADAAIDDLNAMQPALEALATLTKDLDERYAALKRERALMDYSDLERFTLDILENTETREEIAERYDGVFVDEYQDISGVQEAILNALKRDVSRETSDGLPQRFFYVGDVKQSIYRFRQADPTLFMGKAQTFSPEESAEKRRIGLNANFRSRESVLSAVNRVFEKVMRADVTEIEYNEEARLYPGLPSAGDPPVTLHVFARGDRAAERTKLQAYAVGREINRRVGRPITDRNGEPAGVLHYRDIAVLGPKMKGVSDVMERTFSEMGIPVYCEDRGSGMESEEISQALNHLRLMDNLADDLSLMACLRGPEVGMDERELADVRLGTPQGSYLNAVRAAAARDDALGRRCADALAMLEHERFLLAETPLPQYLWGWLSRSGLYAFYGCQPGGRLKQANLRMLCQKAEEHVRLRGGGLSDFLNAVEAKTGVHDSASPTVLSPREDVVRVMTIHKSKGLEFPVVFVTGLEESFGRRKDSALAMHPRLGVALPYVNEEARTTHDTLLKAAVTLRSHAEERAERARLLYVAMTRAKDELILMGSDAKATPEALTGDGRRTEEGSAYAIFGADSMLSWVCECLNGGDELCEESCVSNISLRRNEAENAFSTESTCFPRKKTGWKVVFHNDEEELQEALRVARGETAVSDLDERTQRLRNLMEAARASASATGRETDDAVDPVAPPLSFSHHPFKAGVTALAYAEREAHAALPTLEDPDEGDVAQAEKEELKRVPLPLARPRRMDDLPAAPEFLRPPAEQTGLRRGVATHKALSLLAYPGLRAARDDERGLRDEVARQLDALCEQRLMAEEERGLVDARSVARFFQSPCGRQALDAATVRREWSFNLLLPERDGLVAQGIIDLCYLVNDRWALVDYKTDRVGNAEALWDLYGIQIGLYRRALREATGIPVEEATLFSLSLGEGATRRETEA